MKTLHIIVLLVLCVQSYGATRKKDFRGLFGSYRGEKLFENEARSTDFGLQLGFGTLIPINGLVGSVETSGNAASPLYFSTFFNLEGGLFLTAGYRWIFSVESGYCSFETRKQNTVFVDTTSANLPLFHQFSMTAIPIMAGVRYRFSRNDIVPYAGLAGGVSLITQRGFYDYSTTESVTRSVTAFTGQVLLGLEFYISPNFGIRLEGSGWMFIAPASTYAPALPNFPNMSFTANPFLARYSSSLFLTF